MLLARLGAGRLSGFDLCSYKPKVVSYYSFLRLPWDLWSSDSWPICNQKDEIAQIELKYLAMADVVEAQLINMSGCPLPCSYSEYRLVGSPSVVDLTSYGFQLSFAKTEAWEEREALVYEFVSFVSEFGGSLGLFLGFSFYSVWDVLELFLAVLYKQRKKLLKM